MRKTRRRLPQDSPELRWPITLKSEAEVHEVMELAIKAGALIAKEPQKVFWGGYSGYFTDPNGYYWEVAYNPHWSFDENDMLIL